MIKQLKAVTLIFHISLFIQATEENFEEMQQNLMVPIHTEIEGRLILVPLLDTTFCDQEWLRQVLTYIPFNLPKVVKGINSRRTILEETYQKLFYVKVLIRCTLFSHQNNFTS